MDGNEAGLNCRAAFLDARWPALLLQICLLAGLLACSYLAVRRGVAAWYFRKGSPEAIQAAIRWDPANPEYYDALGTLMHFYASGAGSQEIVDLYRQAVRRSPHDAQYWSDLGASYDWAGRPDEAFAAFQRARQLFPHSPEINWRLANFCIRTGKVPEALEALKTVLESNGLPLRDVFVLAANSRLDEDAFLQVFPPEPLIFFDYLNFRIQRNDIASAEKVWNRILRLNLRFDPRWAMPYLDALIQHRELPQLSNAWSALTQRFFWQLGRLHSASNLITNGDFEFDALNGGFDWHVLPAEGATVGWDSADRFGSTRLLRITFDGSRNVDYENVFQYVLVQPNTRYRFSVHMRAKGITSDSGPQFQLSDAYNPAKTFATTEELVGTYDWTEQHLQFKTDSDTRLLLVKIVRPWSAKLDSRLEGSVWIGHVNLTAEP